MTCSSLSASVADLIAVRSRTGSRMVEDVWESVLVIVFFSGFRICLLSIRENIDLKVLSLSCDNEALKCCFLRSYLVL